MVYEIVTDSRVTWEMLQDSSLYRVVERVRKRVSERGELTLRGRAMGRMGEQGNQGGKPVGLEGHVGQTERRARDLGPVGQEGR